MNSALATIFRWTAPLMPAQGQLLTKWVFEAVPDAWRLGGVTTLSLNGALTPASAFGLASIMRQNKSVTSLECWYNSISAVGGQLVADALESNEGSRVGVMGGNTSVQLRGRDPAANGGTHLARMDGGELRVLVYMLRHNPQPVTSVDLCNMDLGGIGSFASVVPSSNAHVGSGHFHDPYDAGGLRALSRFLSSGPRLCHVHTLVLRQCRIAGLDVTTDATSVGIFNPAGILALSEGMRHCPSLTSVDLCANHIMEQGAATLRPLAAPGTRLVELQLWGNKVPLDCLRGLMRTAGVFSCFRNMTRLCLSGRCMDEVDGDVLVGMLLDAHCEVEELDLSDNPALGVQTVIAVCSRLLPRGRLTSLEMRRVAPPSHGPTLAAHVVAALRDNTSLTRLDVSDCAIGGAALVSIGQALTCNTTLVHLLARNAGAPHGFDVSKMPSHNLWKSPTAAASFSPALQRFDARPLFDMIRSSTEHDDN